MSAYSQFLVRIFSHVTKTIEVDGILIESQKTDGFIIGPGQRVSVLVESLTNPISGSPYFIIAARGKSTGFFFFCFLVPMHDWFCMKMEVVCGYLLAREANTARP